MSKHQTDNYQRPHIALIVAMTKDRVIGSEKGLPWELPEDLQLFKKLTMGSTVIMGRKTYETIGHPLPGRHNIVLSRSNAGLTGVITAKSFIEALAAAAAVEKNVFVIGGAELYRKSLPIASELHISWVNGFFHGDTYFPEFNLEDWTASEVKDFSGFRYIHYLRKKSL